MWWAVFAVINWAGVAYLKERGPEVLKPAPPNGQMTHPNYVILALCALGIFSVYQVAMKWIKKKI